MSRTDQQRGRAVEISVLVVLLVADGLRLVTSIALSTQAAVETLIDRAVAIVCRAARRASFCTTTPGAFLAVNLV